MPKKKTPKGNGPKKKKVRNLPAIKHFRWMEPGSISVQPGSNNLLLVVPHGWPDDEYNIDRVGVYLAWGFDCEAVINFRLYNRLDKRPSNKYQADLENIEEAVLVPRYWESIRNFLDLMAERHVQSAIVIFLHGMHDDYADKFSKGLLFVVGEYPGEDRQRFPGSASPKFFEAFIEALARWWIPKFDAVQCVYRDVGNSPGIPTMLRQEYKGRVNVEAIRLAIRCSGHLETAPNVFKTQERLKQVLWHLPGFIRFPDSQDTVRRYNEDRGAHTNKDLLDEGLDIPIIQEKEELPDILKKMVDGLPEKIIIPKKEELGDVPENRLGKKKGEKKINKDVKRSKASMDSLDDQSKPKPGVPTDTLTISKPSDADQPSIAVIGEEKLSEIIAGIKSLDQIINDDAEEVEFSGRVKEEYISDLEQGYSVAAAMIKNLYDTGKFLYDVRERQRQNKLWIRFLETIGLARRTAHNYIQAYERFGDRLPEFSYLGISKLLSASQLKDPVNYLEEHAPTMAKETTRGVQKRIADEKKKTRRGMLKQKHHEIVHKVDYQDVKVTFSVNGQVLKISGLNRELQEQLLTAIKELFSQKK